MLVVISYDVAVTSEGGRKRLRDLAQACKDYGQRVQFSVFECSVGATQWALLRHRILTLMDEQVDSVRFYFLGEDAGKRSEHHGAKKPRDLDGPLVV